MDLPTQWSLKFWYNPKFQMKQFIGILLIFTIFSPLSSCNFGKKREVINNDANRESTSQNEMMNIQYIDKELKLELDQLIDKIGELGGSAYLTKLISSDKSTYSTFPRPDYLMPLQKAATLSTIEAKYRAAVVYKADMMVASLYKEPLTDYKQTIAHLLIDINNPGFNINLNEAHRRSVRNVKKMVNELYNEAYKENRIDLFWEAAACGVIEELFLLSHNLDKIPVLLSDQDITVITKRLHIVIEGINKSIPIHPELSKVKGILKPISSLKAVNISQLQRYLTDNKENLSSVRENLF